MTSHQKKLLSASLFALSILLLSPLIGFAEQLSQETSQRFDQYISAKEETQNRALAAKASLLSIDGEASSVRSQAYDQLRQGQIILKDNCEGETAKCGSIPGGLIHDWSGIIFVPGVSLAEALATLQDYNRDNEYYQAEVVRSRLISHSENDFQVALRLKRTQIITVVLDTEYDIRYLQMDSNRAFARSHSTRIAEVDHAGTQQERELPVGNDHGFLWRLYSYWYFYQTAGGIYIQCNAVSLTRDIPVGLGWLIESFIKKIPADSLRSTLIESRAAMLARSAKGGTSK
jgi:hypothetical protein